jgi:hypothetical protein
VRIPSWLEADPALHSEAVYIEADRFFHQKILLAIGRRTIHSDPLLDRAKSQDAQHATFPNQAVPLTCGVFSCENSMHKSISKFDDGLTLAHQLIWVSGVTLHSNPESRLFVSILFRDLGALSLH